MKYFFLTLILSAILLLPTHHTSASYESINFNYENQQAGVLESLSSFFGAIFSGITQQSHAQSPDITSGLVGHWKFDEGSGTTANDSSGNNNTGALNPTVGGPTWSTGQINGALSFDGSDDYINIPDTDALDLVDSDFTLSAWIYARSLGESNNGRIVDKNGGVSNGWTFNVNPPQELVLQIDGADRYSNDEIFSLNQWQHVAVTFNSSTFVGTFYVNGVPQGNTTTYGSAVAASTYAVRIGNRAADDLRNFDGLIDDVRIYNRALSAAEVWELSIYTGGEGQTCGNSIVEGTEQCDQGASNGACPATCSSSCTINSCGGDITPPSTPTNLSATAVSSSQINLSWSASTDNVGVTGYNIRRCTGSSCTPTFLTTTSNTSYSNTGLSQSTTYTYTVSAHDAAGNTSPLSTQAQATTPSAPTGNTYWVDDNGTGTVWSNCQNVTPLSGTSACTLQTANQNASAGQTVYLRAGTYNQYIQPVNSGTALNRITYQRYGAEIVTIQNNAYGINLNGNDYITVEGINFDGNTHFFTINNGDYNIIDNSTFINGTYSAWQGARIYNNSTYNVVKNSTIAKYANCSGGEDNGVVLEIGTEESNTDTTSYNLLDNVTMYHGGHHVLGINGRYNTIRNSYFHNEAGSWCRYIGADYGNRSLMIIGATNSAFGINNLFEGNRVGYSDRPVDQPGDGVSVFVVAGDKNIIRYNSIFRASTAGLAFGTGPAYPVAPSYNYVYNNNMFDNGQDELGGMDECGISFNDWGHSGTIQGNVFKNNILYSNGTPVCSYGFSGVNQNDQTFANNWEEAGDPKYTNISGTDPTSRTNPNFNLQSGSPAINAGGALTTVAAADTGFGTSLVVSDADYFQDGTWAPSGTIDADWIAVGTVGNIVQISSISSNTITLSNSISRQDGDLVWLYKDSDGTIVLYGSAPDIGAHEYNSGPPPPTCTSFTYSSWGVCQSNSTQTRTILTSSPIGCTGGNPITIQSCTPQSDITPPSIPTNLIATAVSPSQINLTWSASTDNVAVTGYNIYRCTGQSCTPTFLTTTSNTSYSNAGLSPETTYTYTVSAYDAAGNTSSLSTQAQATTQEQTGTTINAASCSYSDVSSAINSASPGDTVQVPAGTGSCTWSSILSINKGINLIGPGSSNLTITTVGIDFYPPQGTADVPFRLSGFRFDDGGGCSRAILNMGYYNNTPTGLNNNKFTQIRVDNNIFNSTCTGFIPLIWLQGTGYHGVYDHNTMTTFSQAFRSTNNELGDENWNYWPYYPGMEAQTKQGHGDSVFIEDNIITLNGSDNALISSQGAHRYVIRYNTVSVNSGSWALMDAHGNDPCCFASTMGALVYGNHITQPGNQGGFLLSHRGGQSMVFGNNWNSTGYVEMNVYQLAAGSAGPGPEFHAITGQPQEQWKSYYFNNKKSYTSSFPQANIGEQYGGVPDRNQDFWDEYDWIESSAGVGCGSSLPSGSLTEGVGFWLTTQSCSNITDYVGASPTTAISGTLYIANASNTWVPYYTPFTYPHPLTLGTSPTLRADLNGDYTVNSLDWSIMSTAWGTNDPVADINDDGIVNTLDWSIMNSEWGQTA